MNRFCIIETEPLRMLLSKYEAVKMSRDLILLLSSYKFWSHRGNGVYVH